jgi:lysozyme family protein
MKDNYDRCLAEVLEQEGGYSNDPGDSGGPTKYGITIHDARMYWKHGATAADVRAMPLDVAKQIYRSKYWDAISGDDLPSGVDLAVFDYGVNSGIHRAAMVLQRFLGVPDDGVIGPHTLDALREQPAGDAHLVAEICDERLAFLRRLGIWHLFGRGWGRRVAEVKALALKMATPHLPAEPQPGEA